MLCPCSKYENRIHQSQLTMGKHIVTNGFVANYTRWICHGEVHRARQEAVRQRIDDYDTDAGCAEMLADFHEAHFEEGPREEPLEPTTKQYYDMCLRHRNHFTSIPMFLSSMLLHAYWP